VARKNKLERQEMEVYVGENLALSSSFGMITDNEQ
jgi:hypothetical protein